MTLSTPREIGLCPGLRSCAATAGGLRHDGRLRNGEALPATRALPLEVTPGLFTATPIFGGAATPDEPEGRGFRPPATVAALPDAGRIIEITGPGGGPSPPDRTPEGPPAPDHNAPGHAGQ
ncbi:hypothetical protein [Actinomadura roseirufa]|uniref:hypothetical protein n=1 Tax=Actinomadura roseirufa TaxID=2094049 RepID=UPI0010413F1D|nr:hypothetical protein [Actinomadura roseirufa]